MLKEKYKNAKQFVKEHGTEIALGGMAILGVALIGQQVTINKMVILHKEEINTMEILAKLVDVVGEGINMANEDLEALAEINGKTIEDVWEVAFNKKYNLK